MPLIAWFWIIWATVAAVGIAAKSFKRRAAARAAAAQEAAEEARRREQQRRRMEAQQAAEQKRQAAQEAKERADRERERQQAEKAAARAAREQDLERKRAERLEAARQLAEYKERALQAEKALHALEREQPKEAPSSSEAAPAAVSLDQFAAAHPAEAQENPRTFADLQSTKAPTFAGEVVAFTGKLHGMTRAEAIRLVQDRGGRAFKTMPAGTTLLVVGQNPGMQKLDKADEWIAQVKKITQAQFMERINAAA